VKINVSKYARVLAVCTFGTTLVSTGTVFFSFSEQWHMHTASWHPLLLSRTSLNEIQLIW
jgi:hypothetical protein